MAAERDQPEGANAPRTGRLAAFGGWIGQWSGAAVGAMLGTLVPPLCAACQTRLGTADSLCADCWRSISFIHPPVCDRLGIPLPYAAAAGTVSAQAIAAPPDYDRARAVAVFGATLRDMVHAFKYGDQHHARRLFGAWLVAAGGELLADAHVIVPVPLHRLRLIKRRFNQAAVLAIEVSHRTGQDVDLSTLSRLKATSPQVGRTRAQRQEAMQGAFRVAPDRIGAIAGRNVLLLDDVITTGATVNACARALRRAGAARVDVLALGLVTEESGAA